MQKVCIVTVHYGSAENSLGLLESLDEMGRPSDVSLLIVVADNDPDSHLLDSLRKWALSRGLNELEGGGGETLDSYSSATFIRDKSERRLIHLSLKKNYGYAGGINRAVERVLSTESVDYFWILNNDISVSVNALESLLAKSAEFPRAVLGAKLVTDGKESKVEACGGAIYLKPIGRSRHIRTNACITDIDYVVGASMFIPKETLEKVGRLPEHFFLYFEEVEWCFRARSLGFELAYSEETILKHKHGASTGISSAFRRWSDKSFFYFVRASLLFSWTRYKQWLLFVIAYSLCDVALRTIQGDYRKIAVYVSALKSFSGYLRGDSREYLKREPWNCISRA